MSKTCVGFLCPGTHIRDRILPRSNNIDNSNGRDSHSSPLDDEMIENISSTGEEGREVEILAENEQKASKVKEQATAELQEEMSSELSTGVSVKQEALQAEKGEGAQREAQQKKARRNKLRVVVQDRDCFEQERQVHAGPSIISTDAVSTSPIRKLVDDLIRKQSGKPVSENDHEGPPPSDAGKTGSSCAPIGGSLAEESGMLRSYGFPKIYCSAILQND